MVRPSAATTTDGARLYVRAYTEAGVSTVLPVALPSPAVALPANTWTQITGTVEIPANNVTMAIGFYLEAAYTGSAIFASPVVQSMADPSLIVDGGILARHILADQIEGVHVKANSLSFDKLAGGTISALAWIIAGNPDGAHARLDSTGFRAFVATEDGPMESIRLGTGGSDLFAITSAAGEVVASISGEGDISGREANFASLAVGGETLATHIASRPRGIVAWATTGASAGPAAGTTWQPLLELWFWVDPGRLVRIYTDNLKASMSASNGGALFMVSKNDSGVYPDVSMGWMTATLPGNTAGYGDVLVSMSNLMGNDTTTPIQSRVVLYYRSLAAAPTVSTRPWANLVVEDIGPFRPATGTYRGGGAPVDSGNREYTSEWVSNGGGTYRGNGTLRTDTTDMRQGYVGQQNGDQHGIALFTGNAVSGETDKTIAAALSGATIRKVEVYLYANHWHSSSGGTAMISAHSLTAMASTTPNTAKVLSAGWPKPGGRWVDITSIFDSSKRGIWVGKTGSSSLTTYGWFNGAGASSNKPRLRATYTR